jgi:hypothetical protein
VVVPKAPKKAGSWTRLKLHASDTGSDVAKVKVAVNQKRAGTWYAFNGTTWTKAKNGKAKRWLPADAAKSGTTWRLKVPGLTTGKLVVRARATDGAHNHSAVVKATQRLTKNK